MGNASLFAEHPPSPPAGWWRRPRKLRILAALFNGLPLVVLTGVFVWLAIEKANEGPGERDPWGTFALVMIGWAIALLAILTLIAWRWPRWGAVVLLVASSVPALIVTVAFLQESTAHESGTHWTVNVVAELLALAVPIGAVLLLRSSARSTR